MHADVRIAERIGVDDAAYDDRGVLDAAAFLQHLAHFLRRGPAHLLHGFVGKRSALSFGQLNRRVIGKAGLREQFGGERHGAGRFEHEIAAVLAHDGRNRKARLDPQADGFHRMAPRSPRSCPDVDDTGE